MTTFAAVLAEQLRREPGRPLVTFYDHASDERVELSVTTYANWVAKAASLLVEEADLERGMRLRVDLPPHWLGAVFVGAGLTIGAVIVDDDDADVVVCGPDRVEHWAREAGGRPVLACSLLPLGVRFATPLPAGVLDVGVEVWSQPDAFTPYDPPSPDDPATDELTHGELMAAGTLQADTMKAAATGTSHTGGGRLLSVSNPASPPEMSTFTEPLAHGGSLVLVRNLDPSRLDHLVEAERVTHRV